MRKSDFPPVLRNRPTAAQTFKQKNNNCSAGNQTKEGNLLRGSTAEFMIPTRFGSLAAQSGSQLPTAIVPPRALRQYALLQCDVPSSWSAGALRAWVRKR